MRKFMILFLFLFLIPFSSALEFTQDTSFNEGDINFKFIQGVELDSFQIITDGIIVNDEHKFVFIVAGGELDVTFYEWSETDNKIGLQGDAAQDLIFKITVENKKQYLQDQADQQYYVNSIPIDTEEKFVTYLLYQEEDTSTTVTRTITKDKWHQAKFFEFEYNVEKDENGVITSESFGVSYLMLSLFIIFIIILILVVRK